jgi:hypothetical protein
MPTVTQLSELQKSLAAYAAAAPPPPEEEPERRARRRAARPAAEPPPPPAPAAPVEDYDDLAAEEVISLLGSLEAGDLLALREYEATAQGRDAVIRAIDAVLVRRELAGTH